MSRFEELAERVERLLVRHEEMQRRCAELERQLAEVTQERDGLHARLVAARQRVDALLERLPVGDGSSGSSA
ncbi:DUF904 domain-containing protein [Caldimonas tepidiphila]|uniref:DUF904 domain-containing protein n=1 Tax=Caldimonas tepidiphila TaxID=2315841 RepID=UPI000E5BA55A|nr:DUF904 domain-containing protein [Caldimonas tepidiphila]